MQNFGVRKFLIIWQIVRGYQIFLSNNFKKYNIFSLFVCKMAWVTLLNISFEELKTFLPDPSGALYVVSS